MPRSDSSHVALVMPAYDEEGIVDFLEELWSYLHPRISRLSFVVVDDCSPTPVADLVREARSLGRLGPSFEVTVLRNPTNLGHGPSVTRAYRAALDTGASSVVHVDGDGQFSPEGVLQVLEGLTSADVVQGTRLQRDDPWYRASITWALRQGVRAATSGSVDPNCPLRAFERTTLERLLPLVPQESLVPHVHLSVLTARLGITRSEVSVVSRPRIGSGTGTMWKTDRRAALLPPRRLMVFCWQAMCEVVGESVRDNRRELEAAPTPTPTPLPAAGPSTNVA